MEFKLGDRVKGKAGVPEIGGKVGTVMAVLAGYSYYGVQFDEPISGGHDFDNPIEYKNGHCRWVDEEEIDLLPQPYFADARVGDSVYSTTYGDVTIISINRADIYYLKVTTQGGHILLYTLEGYSINATPIQSLFYSKPIFDIPPPPKRTVKKVIEGWINLYNDTACDNVIYNTKEAADLMGVGEAHFIHHEYEVEE